MTLDLTRRSLLKFMGGAVAGAVLSPLPWKLLDDASIWTQNWSLIARPPRGPVSWRDTTCTLCPAGCPLRARLVGAAFVSAWPRPGAASGSRPCPLGLAAAQMRWHPARVRGACRRDASRGDAPWSLANADGLVADLGRQLAALRDGGGERVAVLDLRPGRALSSLYRDFIRQQGGLYVVAPDAWQASAVAFTALAGGAALVPAPDPSRAGAVLGLGTPLADGYGRLRMTATDGRAAGSRPWHIQADVAATATAARADRWLPIRPGSEAPLALALAHVLVLESRAADPRALALAHRESAPDGGTFAELLADFPPERVAEACGLSPAVIRETARELASRRPALVLGVGDPGAGPLGADEETAAWCLNVLLAREGAPAALGARPADGAAWPSAFDDLATLALDEVPDGSLDLLIVDGSFPGAPLSPAVLRRKLRGAGSRIVALSPYAGGTAGRAADLLLPTPAPGEWLDDVPTPALAPRAAWAWAPAVAAAPEWAAHPAEWLARLSSASGIAAGPAFGPAAHGAELARRAACLHANGEGRVHDPRNAEPVAVASLAGSDALADVLARGGAWSGAEAGAADLAQLSLPGSRSGQASRWRALRDGRPGGGPLVVIAGGGLTAAMGAVGAPVLTKLGRESGLVAGPGQAGINPRTAAGLGLADAAEAGLATAHGTVDVIVRHDRALPPGIVRLSAGPDPLELGDDAAPGTPAADLPALCGALQQPVWRLCGATLKEVRRAHA